MMDETEKEVHVKRAKAYNDATLNDAIVCYENNIVFYQNVVEIFRTKLKHHKNKKPQSNQKS